MEGFELFLIEFNITTLDKSTADILSPRMVVMFEQPQEIVLVGCPSNSFPQERHLIRMLSIVQYNVFLLSQKSFHIYLYGRRGDRTPDRLGVNEMLYR